MSEYVVGGIPARRCKKCKRLYPEWETHLCSDPDIKFPNPLMKPIDEPNKSGMNPKDIVGDNKLPLHLFPPSAIAYGSIGMLEGRLKYGYVNYRGTNVIASTYIAAAKRHLDAWLEGEDKSPDTNSHHLGNALATIAIIVDAITNGTLNDDRPLVPNAGAYRSLAIALEKQVIHLKQLFKEKNPKHWYQVDSHASESQDLVDVSPKK